MSWGYNNNNMNNNFGGPTPHNMGGFTGGPTPGFGGGGFQQPQNSHESQQIVSMAYQFT